MLVELLSCHPGLDNGVEIFGVDPQNSIHLRQIDANAARKCGYMTLKRCPRPKGDDRSLVIGASLDDGHDFLGVASKGDGVRSVRGMIGLVFAVLGADRR